MSQYALEIAESCELLPPSRAKEKVKKCDILGIIFQNFDSLFDST